MHFKIILTTLCCLAGNLISQTAPSTENTAVVPKSKLENDFYDWNKRHEAILALKETVKPEVVMMGDSITHLWAGQPNEPHGNRGPVSWKALFGDKPVLNLGFGWDRTQNVLFRIENGELDGLEPKLIVIHIGTNNLAGTKNARENTPTEIASAIGLIVDKTKQKCPGSKIVLMAVFPRGEKPTDPNRAKIAAINRELGPIAAKSGVPLIDLTQKFLNPDGTISKEVMGDFLHPAEKGYGIWAEALKPFVK